MDLILLLIEEAKTERATLREQLQELRSSMGHVSNTQQLPLEEKLTNDLKKLETTIKKIKLRKFKRDEDYSQGQVYQWDKPPRRACSYQRSQPPARERRVSFNLTSSEDELHQSTIPSPQPQAKHAGDERKRGHPQERAPRRTGLRSPTPVHRTL